MTPERGARLQSLLERNWDRHEWQTVYEMGEMLEDSVENVNRRMMDLGGELEEKQIHQQMQVVDQKKR